MKNSASEKILLPLYAKINHSVWLGCIVIGFALAAPFCWPTALIRLLLDFAVLTGMVIFSHKLMYPRKKPDTQDSLPALETEHCPEEIGTVKPLTPKRPSSPSPQYPEKNRPEDSSPPPVLNQTFPSTAVSQKELERLHKQLVQAQRENGEEPSELSNLQEVVTRTAKQVFDQHACHGIAFEVIRHQGKVTLQPRILRKHQSHQDRENRVSGLKEPL